MAMHEGAEQATCYALIGKQMSNIARVGEGPF
jgi:hypothetical protein